MLGEEHLDAIAVEANLMCTKKDPDREAFAFIATRQPVEFLLRA